MHSLMTVLAGQKRSADRMEEYSLLFAMLLAAALAINALLLITQFPFSRALSMLAARS